MNLQPYITQMTNTAEAIRTLVQDVDDEQARWKPTPDEWSLLEVVNHLYDEERRDFRVRIDYTLHRRSEDGQSEEWPPINPPQWAIDEAYNTRDLAESLENFLAERRHSLAWLADLSTADWSTAAVAPWGDTMRAGDLLAAWTAHDLLHIRQLNELRYRYLQKITAPFEVRYAGEW